MYTCNFNWILQNAFNHYIHTLLLITDRNREVTKRKTNICHAQMSTSGKVKRLRVFIINVVFCHFLFSCRRELLRRVTPQRVEVFSS